MSSLCMCTTLLAVCVALYSTISPTLATQEDDFAFDVNDDLEVEFDGTTGKLWIGREVTVVVGRALHLVVPKEAFGRQVQSYEAKRHGGKGLPSWLLFDKTGGVFWGIPLAEDVGTLHITIKSIGAAQSNSVDLTIYVLLQQTSEGDGEKCPPNEDTTILTLLIDKNIRAIKPKQRIIAINNIAKFFGLPYSAFTLKPQVEVDDITDSSVVLAGPGNLKSRSSKLTSLLQVPVGCDGRLWVNTASMVHQLKQQAKDGTIAEVLRLPLIGWRVKTETVPIIRSRREVDDDYENGSGDDYDQEYYEDYDAGVVEEGLSTTATAATTTTTTTTPITPITTTISSNTGTGTGTHPHRHHHGEPKITSETNESVTVVREHHTHPMKFKVDTTPLAPTSPATTTTTSTTTTTTEKPSTPSGAEKVASTVDETDYDYETYDQEDDDDYESVTVVPESTVFKQTVPVEHATESSVATTTSMMTTISTTTTTKQVPVVELETTVPTTTTTTTTTEAPTTFIIEETEPEVVVAHSETITTPVATTLEDVTLPVFSTTPVVTVTTTTTPASTTTELPTTREEEEPTTVFTTSTTSTTSTPLVTSTQKSTTTVREVTESLEYGDKNFKPYIENRLQQMSVIAGKIFRFVVPKNTFKDFEDGDNLRLEFLDKNEQPITKNSWCQFNPARREVYGLPLEEDVSKWVYYIRAIDQEGAYEQDKLTIQVQQHKLDRVMNHEFSLQIRIEKHQEFPHFVDWSLKVLRALGKLYNTNMSEITVRQINYTSEPVVFTWANDSIPTNFCPRSEIEHLYKALTANDRGDPSRELNVALAPELRVKKVLLRELGVCEQPQTPVTPPMNFSPILRNPVDHVNATVGELLVYKVKDDTFYDPEDVDPRTLNISLLTGDRRAIPTTNWLQFDSKNREFFGIPLKAGRSEYQLVCVDSGGLPATDSLEVVVYNAPKRQYNVEFSMTIEISYDTFINSASMQKKYVEKLRDLFGDKNTSHIHFHPFKHKERSTVVTWFNKTLPTERCAHEEITRLESVMNNLNERSISSRVHSIMEPEFPVSKIHIHLINNCKQKTVILPPPPPPEIRPPVDETAPKSSTDEYLITFIVPAVIISIMLFLAAIAACVLYRRRRTGKMNVEEDGRQSYGNKGIPVIFQEELEEKPEPGTKTPVILKDEKPPLAPPEYSRSGSVRLTDDSEPYQPPPPFTRSQDNGRQARPKPTPTYRKPPPYVPP